MLASALSSNSVVVFSTTDWESVATLSQSDSAYSIDFSLDSKTLVVGSYDGTALVYSTCTWERTHKLTHHSIVFAVVFAPHGDFMASAALEFCVCIWDTATWERKHELTHSDWVYAIAFSPLGTEIATASKNHHIYLWDVSSGRRLRTLTGHTDAVRSVGFSPCGSLLASAAADGRVLIFSKPRFQLAQALRAVQARLALLERRNRAVVVALDASNRSISGTRCAQQSFWIERICSTLYLPKPAISAVFHFIVHDVPKPRWP
jgi:hypothetical protein